jgi:PAS domain-containing protein
MISYVQNLTEHFRYSRQFYYLILDLNGNYSYINPLFRETFNPRYPAPEAVLPAFACSEYNKLIKATKECLRNPSSSVIIETANKSVHGDPFLIKWEISAVTDEEGKPESVQAIGVNIHAGFNCKQANNTQKETEERFRRLVSDLKFGVTMRDSEGKALLCNKAMLEFSGL